MPDNPTQPGEHEHDDAMQFQPGEGFDPRAAAAAGLLRLGRNSKGIGAIHQAIHVYEEVLTRYPGTDAASAATAELVALAQTLEQQGKVHTAQKIFDDLEQLL